MKKVHVKVLSADSKKGNKEVTAYKFEHELICGASHDFLAAKDGQDRWSVYEFKTGASLCGGSKTRKDIIEHLTWVLERQKLTKRKMVGLINELEVLNECNNSTMRV